MRVEIVAVGTELLLGQIADTNSAWLGDHLASAGVTSHFHQAVGDNHERMTLAFRTALARSDGIIVCGGLGPTQDDITREAIADVMGVELVRDQKIVDVIAGFFQTRGRAMSANNERQADVPAGATIIPQRAGTAPGLICPLGNKVIYAVPGVPYEMAEMFERGILPDLRARMAAAGEENVIVSRVLRTWGASESGLAEALQGRIDALDAFDRGGSVTLAFLASGMEGIKVRITARAADPGAGDRPPRPRGEGGALDHRVTPRRHRLRDRRRVHGARRGGPAGRARAELRRGRVAHRRSHRVPPGQRPRRLGLVPGRRGGLPLAGEVRRARGARRPGGLRGGRRRHGARGVPGHRFRRRAGHHRGGRAGRPGGGGAGHHLRRVGPAPTAGPRPARCACRAIGNGCASTGRSRPSTSCAGRSSPWAPDQRVGRPAAEDVTPSGSSSILR